MINWLIIRAIDCKEGKKKFWNGKEYTGKEAEAISVQPAYPVFAFESTLSGEENEAENRMKVERGGALFPSEN